ncbi:hypothetical protein AAFF_G00378090 [Aldrovandia affinis]|uniref:Fork-head domain-containing protein n=1 Tax=Aldrovandia affinis TaxID=143900 RepID=A0AAD7SGB3_9TELE|nr:hypothetical protein AAFF_G00378090 [Aldrovandia affinis]
MEENKVPHIDPDFEPQSRPRSCTWPLPRPDISVINQEGMDSVKFITETPPAEDDKQELTQFMTESEKVSVSEGVTAELGGATQRKSSSRRNAWGNQSYADLISQAIENSPEKRLTLAQVYDWMVKTVPYFKDKGDCNSSAGWKNSIRHNLSLHNKFLRVHNESTGKSSWWMLNPEGVKGGKAPRRRATSMDNSSKLLKSRMRAKQTKKQAGVTGLAVPKMGVNTCSSISHGTLEDPDAWTSFRPRPRTSSNASTLSGRQSPVVLGQEDKDELPEDGLLGGYSAGSLPSTLSEALMEELDLIDGLTLMIGQSGGASPSITPSAPPTPLPSAATLLPCGFPSFPSQQPTKPPQHSCQTGTRSSISQDAESSSGFRNSLFSPMTGTSSQGGHISAHVPSSLEALLTSDSPPPCDVMMNPVDLLMPSQDGTGLLGLDALLAGGQIKASQFMLGSNFKPISVTNMNLQPQQPSHSQFGMLPPDRAQDSPQLSTLKTQFTQGPSSQSWGLPFGEGVSPASGSAGLHGLGPFGGQSCFMPSQDRLPTDLDFEMFTENLDCDVDYIINSDLMDGEGIDFNFDPILPTGQDEYRTDFPRPT